MVKMIFETRQHCFRLNDYYIIDCSNPFAARNDDGHKAHLTPEVDMSIAKRNYWFPHSKANNLIEWAGSSLNSFMIWSSQCSGSWENEIQWNLAIFWQRFPNCFSVISVRWKHSRSFDRNWGPKNVEIVPKYQTPVSVTERDITLLFVCAQRTKVFGGIAFSHNMFCSHYIFFRSLYASFTWMKLRAINHCYITIF